MMSGLAETNNGKNIVSLRDYLQIIFRRKNFFLMPFLVVFLTSMIGSFFIPRYYESIVIMLVEEENIVNPLAEEQRFPKQQKEETLPQQIKTLTFKILSYQNLFKLIGELGLDKEIKTQRQLEKAIKRIQKHTKVKLLAPEVFQISYEDKDPGMSQKLINTLTKIFVEETARKKRERAEEGVGFAQSEADEYKKKLTQVEQELYEYKEKYPLQLPGEQEDYNIKMLINYQTQLTQLEMAVREAEMETRIIEDQITGREPVIITSELLSLNPIVQRLNENLQELQLKLDYLSNEEPDSEDILNLQIEIENTSEKLRLETEKMVDGETAVNAPLFYQRLEQKLKDSKKDLDKLGKREKDVRALVSDYESKIKSLNDQQLQYVKLVRDFEVNKKIYEMLRVKAEENKLTAQEVQKKGTRYEIIEKARLPLEPSKPQKLLISVVAFVIGSVAGFGCVFLVEFTDHTFLGVEDLKKHSHLPVLGSVSNIKSREDLIFRAQKKKRFAVLFAALVLLLLISGIINSCIQDEKMNEMIRKASLEREAVPEL
ncbi:MAG: GNVR domain-containing protein [bacterium]|nr:GNVR domain-containing protein [bacterium]